MNQRKIDKFFKVFSYNIAKMDKKRIKVILTGAAAGALMGGNRPSIDIDFAISCGKKYLKDIEEAIKSASRITAVAVNFSEDIDRWSQITFLDYKKHTIKYKTFGGIEVSLLSPAYWSIGKITRYLDIDIYDLIKVLRNNTVPPLYLARLWGEALLKSPRSSASFTFKTHVEHFLKTYGMVIWGKGFNLSRCLASFYAAAGIAKSKKEKGSE